MNIHYSFDTGWGKLGVSPYHYNSSNELTDYPGVTYTYDFNGSTKTKTDASGQTTYTGTSTTG